MQTYTRYLLESSKKQFKKTIAIVSGSYKPPTPGHLYMVQHYADEADEVVILVSAPKAAKSVRKTALGTAITPEMSKQIWEIYLKAYSIKNADVQVSSEPSPVTAMFKYVDDNLKDVNVIFGVSKKGGDEQRFKSAMKYYEDNDSINLLDPLETAVEPYTGEDGKAVSATDLRNALDKPDEVKKMLPSKLSSSDKDKVLKILSDGPKVESTYEDMNESSMLSEGKHWPEDYIKTAYNTIKSSPLGQQSWYTDEYLTRDLIGPPIDPNASKQEPVHGINRIDKSDLAHNANKYGILGDFSPLMHKNSNLGFFATIVRWFIEYAGTSQQKYQEFIERKLDGIIGTLQVILNDHSYDKIKDEIKQKWTFAQFEELQKKIADEAKASSDEKLKSIQKRDDYDLIPIYSYEELHEKFGGRWTGYKGQSEWCHTNGKSTYESWTKDGTEMFFVLAKKDWKDIKVPAQKPNKEDNAYDDYGLSLIAILVDVATGNLLNETLRWNHVIEPSYTNPGASVDKAFKNNWGALSQAVGMDVKAACEKGCKDLKQKMQKEADAANEQVEEILRGKTEIDKDTIPDNLRSKLTKVVIPNSVTSIGIAAFYHCSSLTSVKIPSSVTNIRLDAFAGCSSLTNVTIPDSVISIGKWAFNGCSSLTSITIPSSVMNIERNAFQNCNGIISVTIPNTVTTIENSAFDGCSGLTSVTIGNSVTSIGSYAFDGCSGLTSMMIPDNVTSIGFDVFQHCNNLKSLVFKGKTFEEVKAMKNYPWGIRDKSIIKCENGIEEAECEDVPYEEAECMPLDVTDDLLMSSQILAYNTNQTAPDADGKEVPVNPKKFPDRAIDIAFCANGTCVHIFLDKETGVWDSCFKYNGMPEARLSPEQMGQFFGSKFYGLLLSKCKNEWPLTDEMYGMLYDGMLQKKMKCQGSRELQTEDGEFKDDQVRAAREKKEKLRKKEKEKEAKAKYTNSGRKIVSFSDFGVKNSSFRGYCWPTPGKEFRWSTWKDWKKIKPLCRMRFKHNDYNYGVSISTYDENFENRGFRGYNLDIEPPLAWITPDECEQVMQLTLFQKFARHCAARIQKYLDIPTEEILAKINNPEKIDAADIDKTKAVIRKVLKYAIKPCKADTFSWR